MVSTQEWIASVSIAVERVKKKATNFTAAMARFPAMAASTTFPVPSATFARPSDPQGINGRPALAFRPSHSFELS